MRTFFINYRYIFLYLVILASGCALPDKPTQPVYYDLGATLAGAAAAPGVNRADARLPAIVLPAVEAPGALERPAILYRLLYAEPHALRAYTLAQWQSAPTQLVHQRLKTRLAQSRVVLAGTEPSANLAPVLQIELAGFSQQFDAPGSSQGVVQLRATLHWVGPQGDKRVAQQDFAAQRPATSSDAAGGVRALANATDAVVAQVDQWVQGLK